MQILIITYILYILKEIDRRRERKREEKSFLKQLRKQIKHVVEQIPFLSVSRSSDGTAVMRRRASARVPRRAPSVSAARRGVTTAGRNVSDYDVFQGDHVGVLVPLLVDFQRRFVLPRLRVPHQYL